MARDGSGSSQSGVQGNPLSTSQIKNLTVNGCGVLFLIVVAFSFTTLRNARKPITELAFPKTELIEGLLTPITSPWNQPVSKNNRNVHFVKWRNETHVVLQVEEREIRVLDEEWNCTEIFELPGFLGGVFPVDGTSPPPWLVFYGDYGFEAFRTMAFLNADLTTTEVLDLEWVFARTRLTRALTTSNSPNIVITYDSPPEGETAFKGIDLEGNTLWRLPVIGYSNALSTHPDVPDIFLISGGKETSVYRHRVGRTPKRLFKCGRSLKSTHEFLIGRPDGSFQILLQGETFFTEREKLIAFDEEGEELWEAFLPEQIAWFALVEPEGKTPLVAAITWKHRLLLFDLEGTLRCEIQLPYDDSFQVRDIKAGQAGSKWMLSVVLNGEPNFYGVDASLLPSASNAAQEK